MPSYISIILASRAVLQDELHAATGRKAAAEAESTAARESHITLDFPIPQKQLSSFFRLRLILRQFTKPPPKLILFTK